MSSRGGGGSLGGTLIVGVLAIAVVIQLLRILFFVLVVAGAIFAVALVSYAVIWKPSVKLSRYLWMRHSTKKVRPVPKPMALPVRRVAPPARPLWPERPARPPRPIVPPKPAPSLETAGCTCPQGSWSPYCSRHNAAAYWPESSRPVHGGTALRVRRRRRSRHTPRP